MNTHPDHLIQLIYSSVTHLKTTDQQLKDILLIARDNNKRDNITGILLYRQGCFMQVLEGPSQSVTACYKRIIADERHRSATILYQAPIDHRDFKDWAMAYNDNQQATIEGLSDFLHPYRSSDERHIAEGAAKMLINRFREINKR